MLQLKLATLHPESYATPLLCYPAPASVAYHSPFAVWEGTMTGVWVQVVVWLWVVEVLLLAREP